MGVDVMILWKWMSLCAGLDGLWFLVVRRHEEVFGWDRESGYV